MRGRTQYGRILVELPPAAGPCEETKTEPPAITPRLIRNKQDEYMSRLSRTQGENSIRSKRMNPWIKEGRLSTGLTRFGSSQSFTSMPKVFYRWMFVETDLECQVALSTCHAWLSTSPYARFLAFNGIAASWFLPLRTTRSQFPNRPLDLGSPSRWPARGPTTSAGTGVAALSRYPLSGHRRRV